jgi:hexosaminidase
MIKKIVSRRIAALAAGPLLGALLVLTARAAPGQTPAPAAREQAFASVVPAPASATVTPGVSYAITRATALYSQPGSRAAAAVAAGLAALLRPSTGFRLPVVSRGRRPAHAIALLLTGAPGTAGPEGYALDVTASSVVIRANRPAGLFEGVQTLHQLLPAAADAKTFRPGPWRVPGGHIVDHPRFAQRGAMLDVARHFFTVAQVERYIDEISLYKINSLHLHLSDDQGWRIAIDSWPRLATYGGSTEVGGGPGGHYTKADYTAIVGYAAARYITVIPEIDMPGHTNAALASYAELNCNGVAPPLYTGTAVGFSSLCVRLAKTYTFVAQVLGEIAALTPGPYLHIGGDEAHSTSAADYAAFIARVQPIVAGYGKAAVGWEPNLASAALASSTRVQFWDTTTIDPALAKAAAGGTKVVMSPADHAYLDMKYTKDTTLGQNWAGYVDVNKAYGWNPGSYVTGVGEGSVAGVEAPLWTETLVTPADLDYMAFPRLPAIAELGWSPWSTHDQASFDRRLGAQGPRWKVLGVNYYHSAEIAWPPGS